MAQAFRCDMCGELYDETQVSLIKELTFNKKPLEIILRIKDQQINTEYDVCEKCLKEIIVKMAGIRGEN